MSRDKQISFIIGGILSLPIQKYKKNNIKRLEIHICQRWISITHGSVVAGCNCYSFISDIANTGIWKKWYKCIEGPRFLICYWRNAMECWMTCISQTVETDEDVYEKCHWPAYHKLSRMAKMYMINATDLHITNCWDWRGCVWEMPHDSFVHRNDVSARW